MKKYICWYAYKGMETEGRTNLQEPQTFEADSPAEALHKYHCYNAFARNQEPYHKTLTEHLKSEFNSGGWGFFVLELHPDAYYQENSHFTRKYLEKGYNK